MSNQFVAGTCGPGGCPPPTELVCIKTKKVFQECRHTWVPDSITFKVKTPGIVATGVNCGPVFVEPSFVCGNITVPCTTSTPGHAPKLPVTCPPVCATCTPSLSPNTTITPEVSATIAPGNKCPIPTCPPIFFPGEVLRCCIDCTNHEIITVDNSFDIIYTMLLTSGQIFRNRQTIFIPTFPEDFRKFFLSRAGEPGLKCQVEIFAECTQCFISGRDLSTGEITTIDCCFTFTLIGKLFSEVQLLIPAYGYCPLPPECFPPLAVCPTIIPTGIPYPPESISVFPTTTPTPTPM